MKKSNHYVMRELDGEYILIPRGVMTEEKNQIITLSETAAYIYLHIEEAESFDALIRIFLQEYDAEENQARKDIQEVLDGMLKEKILEL